MTTFAWDGETLAADSLSCTGGAIDQYGSPKVFRKKGKVFAVAGDYAQCLAVIEWLCGGDKPSISDPCYTVLALGDRARCYGDQLLPYPVEPPFASGSGGDFALGAMLAGATPTEAVKIAARLDPHTGGRIRTFKI